MNLKEKPIKPTKRITVGDMLWVDGGEHSLSDALKYFSGYNQNNVTFWNVYNKKLNKYGCAVVGSRLESDKEFGDRIRAYYKEIAEYYEWYRTTQEAKESLINLSSCNNKIIAMYAQKRLDEWSK